MAEYKQEDIEFANEESKDKCLAYINELLGNIAKKTEEVEKLNAELAVARQPVAVDDLPSDVLETIKHQGEVEELFLDNMVKDMDDRADLLAKLSSSQSIGQRRKFLVDTYFQRNNMTVNTTWTSPQYDAAFMSLSMACKPKSVHAVTIEKQRGNMDAEPRRVQLATPADNSHFANPFASTKNKMLGIKE